MIIYSHRLYGCGLILSQENKICLSDVNTTETPILGKSAKHIMLKSFYRKYDLKTYKRFGV